jgi:prephenate dehydratase
VAHGGVSLTSVAYQGLAGAFSEAAAAALFPGASLQPRHTFAEVFAALEANEVNAAVVPVENTHAGSVADVYDLLRQHTGAKVVAEAIVRVRHCLLGVRGSRLEGIKVARSHPQALSQVEDFLRKHGIQPEVAFDTAGAAAEVADAKDPSVAAVASRRAAERYGLEVLADSSETSADNFTRFFALAPEADREIAALIPAALRKGPTKTSLVYKTANLPGALVRSLQPFATAWLQLSKIESRPSRAAPWDYVFYLDFEGDPTAWPAKEALALMRTCCEWIQPLGTYQAATEVLEPD